MKKNQKLTLPNDYSEELAEETGIHIGDGNLCFSQSKGKNHWSYSHHGHLIDDKDYKYYVMDLMKSLYNIFPYERRQGNCHSLIYTRKDLVLFKRNLGLPIGMKNDIIIPRWIVEENSYALRCVKGIFDTDGCIRFVKGNRKRHSYPQIRITNKSVILIEQIKKILTKNSIRNYTYKEKRKYKETYTYIWVLTISGKKFVPKFFDMVGSANQKHLKKYKIWKELGYYNKK